MSLTLTSTTSSDVELQRALSDDWRTPPPAKPEDLPPADKNGEISLDKLPAKKFNEIRDQQIAEKKAEGPEFLKAYRKKGSGGYRKVIGAATRSWKSEEARAIAAENRVAELEAQVTGRAPSASGESFEAQPEAQRDGTAPIVPKTELRPGAAERHEAGVRKYGDRYKTALAAGGDALIPPRAVTAIEAARNSEDIVLYLAENPRICEELMENMDSATQRVGEISRELMEHPPQATGAQRQHDQVDQETARQMAKFHGHLKRSEALLAARPDAAKLIGSLESVGISPAVNVALIEQENSEHVLLHLLERPDLRSELNRLSYPTAMARITKIAAQLEANAAAKRERAKPPSPITPVGTSSSRTGLSLDDPSVPMSVYIRERNKHEAQRRRGR